MKRLKMTPISRMHRGREIFIPGDWYAQVPEIMPDAATLDAYTRYFQQSGLTPGLARQEAIAAIQRQYESGHKKNLRDAIHYYACEYADRFTYLWNEDGTLSGFDPERVQSMWVPGENTGRAGKGFVGEMLREMAQGVLPPSEAYNHKLGGYSTNREMD